MPSSGPGRRRSSVLTTLATLFGLTMMLAAAGGDSRADATAAAPMPHLPAALLGAVNATGAPGYTRSPAPRQAQARRGQTVMVVLDGTYVPAGPGFVPGPVVAAPPGGNTGTPRYQLPSGLCDGTSDGPCGDSSFLDLLKDCEGGCDAEHLGHLTSMCDGQTGPVCGQLTPGNVTPDPEDLDWYSFTVPPELLKACEQTPRPASCPDSLIDTLDNDCQAGHCSLLGYANVMRQACGSPDAGPDLVDPCKAAAPVVKAAATSTTTARPHPHLPSGPASSSGSGSASTPRDVPDSRTFTLRDGQYLDGPTAIFRQDGDRFTVVKQYTPLELLVSTSESFLGQLFARIPGAGALTLVEGDGRDYRVVKVPEGTTSEGMAMSYVIVHPDGFTFPVGTYFEWAGLGPHDLITGDTDDPKSDLRPLSDGRYRVVYGDPDTVAKDPEVLKQLFAQVPQGTDTAVLVKGSRRVTVTRPAGVKGPPVAASTTGAAMSALLGDGTFTVKSSKKSPALTVTFRPAGRGKVEVVRNGSRYLAAQQDAVIARLFDQIPNDGTLTIVEGGRDYQVIRAPDDTATNGLRVDFYVTHPDGFNFGVGPMLIGSLWGPNDIVLGGRTTRANAVIRPLRDGTYRVVDHSAGSVGSSVPLLGRFFASLPKGTTSATIIEDGVTTHVTEAPGGHYIVDTPGKGAVYLDDGPGHTVELPVPFSDDSRGNRTYKLPGGETVVRPAPGTALVNPSTDPTALATTPEQVAALATAVKRGTPGPAGGPAVAVVTSANGISTGPAAFNFHFLNSGKPAYVKSDGVVLKPLEGAAASQVRALLDTLPAGGPSASATGYCLEKQERTPAQGAIYTLAPADEQQNYEAVRRILAASARLQAEGKLRPDSNPQAYFHSIPPVGDLDPRAGLRRITLRRRVRDQHAAEPRSSRAGMDTAGGEARAPARAQPVRGHPAGPDRGEGLRPARCGDPARGASVSGCWSSCPAGESCDELPGRDTRTHLTNLRLPPCVGGGWRSARSP